MMGRCCRVERGGRFRVKNKRNDSRLRDWNLNVMMIRILFLKDITSYMFVFY